MTRPDHIPQKIWQAAKGVSVRFADDAEVTRMAEMIMRRQAGVNEPRNARVRGETDGRDGVAGWI